MKLFASVPTTAQPHAALRPARPPRMLSAVSPAVGSLHLPVGGVASLHPLPQEEQQRLHHDVDIKQNQNGKRMFVQNFSEISKNVPCYVFVMIHYISVCRFLA